jgi:prevent-host-death family protein
MGIHVNIGEAKTRLSELVAASLRGEEVTIARAGVPAVRLVPDTERVLDEAEKRAEIARRRKAFAGKYQGMFADVDFAAPTMTETEVEAWMDDQVKRFYSDPDEPAA